MNKLSIYKLKFKLIKRFDTFDILETGEEKSDKNVMCLR